MLRNLGKLILDVLFPRFCLSCGKEEKYLCDDCTLFISEARFICPVCTRSEFFGRRHKSCSEEGTPEGLVALWDYEGLVKKLIAEMKNGSLIDIPEELMEYGFRQVINNRERFSRFLLFLFDEKTVISYVPLHRKKKNRRGFDQAEEIGKILAKVTGKQLFPLLEKERETKLQREMSKKERFLNAKDAFRFTGEKKDWVVLVDDFWESGATMKECTKVLRKNGVEKVWGFTLSKVA